MAEINPNLVYAVNRIECTFRDDIGNHKTIHGTGFWIGREKLDPIFVTNRHNLDPTIKLGPDTTYKLVGPPRIEFRTAASPTPTKFLDVFAKIVMSDSADCAVIEVVGIQNTSDFTPNLTGSINESELADEAFFAEKLNILDAASFIGFPGSIGQLPWWDERFNIPIARAAWLAYPPSVSFEHPEISMKDVSLVNGLSFAGSSGSPLFSHSRGLKIEGKGALTISGGGWRPGKLIGIMSGHTWDKFSEPGILVHSGLSYFTRSTAILALIRTISHR